MEASEPQRVDPPNKLNATLRYPRKKFRCIFHPLFILSFSHFFVVTMPASQLKRLKSSLREQGVTGPQKSKKQKQQQSSQKTSSDRNHRNAALQQIRDSFNPFELKASNSRPEKFKPASANGGSGKYKEILHRPGVTKSAGEEMRRNTLLPEMRRRNKVGGVVDRRIGEGDVDMTPEDRAVQRFAREKERKAKGRSMFDLEGSDDDGPGGGFGLTHGGRRLDDLEADDFGEMSGGDESEDDGELLTRKRRRSDAEEEDEEGESDNDAAEEQPERKKTKTEVMKEVIAKSKLHKYERQKAKEDDDDLRMELDQDFDQILGILQGAKRPQAPPKPKPTPATTSSGPVINPDRQRLLDGMDRSKVDKEYDVRLKQLANDARAKPSERSKTAEEKAQEESKRLQELEEKRQKRMRGEDVSDDEAPKDDAEPGADEDIVDQAAEFGFTNSNAQPKQKSEQLVLDDEDEFALDDNLVASEDEIEDVELSDDEQSDEEEKESDAGARVPLQNEEDEFVKDILGEDVAAASTGANNTSLGERGAASKVAFTYPCPRSHEELLDIVKGMPVEQLTTVIQRIRALYHPSLSASNKESMADFSCALVDHLAYMGIEKQSMAVAEQLIRHLHSLSRTYPTQIGEQFRKLLGDFHERGQPTAGDLLILTAIGSVYPTSDHWHQVVTPATTVMARWLGLNAPTPGKQPDQRALTTGAFIVGLCIKYQALSKRYIPEAVRFTYRALSGKGLQKSTLAPHLANLSAMAELWKDKLAFTEIFAPALPILKSLSAKKELQTLNILLQQSRLRRRPLELHHHRKLAIRTSVPKFEENFNPDKHYDPDKERSDAKKIQKEFKRERKGALRELRKDANFIAREQLRDKRERDAEHERKERRLIAEINAEEGREANEYQREVAKRQRMKKR